MYIDFCVDNYLTCDFYDVSIIVFFCFVFFFFKQKTAYEMRISDWSSDVCSSDLCMFTPAETHIDRGAHQTSRIACLYIGGSLLPQHDEFRGQIGRASCRERVCQYV